MTNDTASELHARIYRVCRSRKVGHEDAMDVAQDILCKMLKASVTISDLESYVIACTFNAIKDLSKRLRRFEDCDQDSREQECHDPPPSNEDELKLVVDLMLSCLTDKQQAAIARWLKHNARKDAPMTGKDRILVYRAFQTCRERFPFAESLVST